jgi:hypothetical protein
LGTPRGRYEEHNSKFPSVVKPRFIKPEEKAKLQKVMLASFTTLRIMVPENAGA